MSRMLLCASTIVLMVSPPTAVLMPLLNISRLSGEARYYQQSRSEFLQLTIVNRTVRSIFGPQQRSHK